MRMLILSLLAGCSGPEASPVDEQVAALPADATGPPALTLVPTGTFSRGSSFGLEVSGAAAGAPITMLAGRGGLALDQGACPPVLGGLCLDMRSGAGGYTVIDTGAADATGRFTWSATIPSTVPTGAWQFQAVQLGATPAESNTIELDLTAACTSDAYEPNDSRLSATPMSSDLPGAVLCPAEADIYAIDVGASTAIEISSTHAAVDGDLDIELETSTGVLLDGSWTLGGTETVTWFNPSPTPTTVYLRVYANRDPGQDGIEYDLTFDIQQPGACVDDAFEDDDDAAHAHLVPAGTYRGAQSCLGDNDWFAVVVAAGEHLSVNVDEPATQGDIDLSLYDESLNLLTPAPVDPIEYDSTITQTYYVEVELVSDDVLGGGNSYDLNIDINSYHTCAIDALEPNNTLVTAAVITPGTQYTDLESCTDFDWYEFQAQAGQTIFVDLLFRVSDGDVDASVFSPTLAPIATGVSGGDNESFYVVAGVSGTYYLEVYLYSDYGPPVINGTIYDMLVRVQ